MGVGSINNGVRVIADTNRDDNKNQVVVANTNKCQSAVADDSVSRLVLRATAGGLSISPEG